MKQKGFSVVILLVGVAILAVGGYFFLWPKIKGTVGPKTQKVYHVGVLSGLSFVAEITDGFKSKMTELGYTEGKNIVYDIQKSDFDMAFYQTAIKKFVDEKVDLILVFPTEASQEAKNGTKGTDIPVVFVNAFTEDTGLVDSVRTPGGNITGVRWAGPDLALQRFEIMQELVPDAKEIVLPYQRDYPIVKSQLEALRKASGQAGLTLVEVPADNAKELEADLAEIATPDAILIMAEPLGVTPDAFVVLGKYASEHKIPFGGAYMSIGGYTPIYGLTPQAVPQGKQAAVLADKVLRGTKAGTIPVVTAENFFQINYKVAQALGLKVPEALLNRADEVIR